MNSAVHAERILQAWECLNFSGLKSAVDVAQASCQLSNYYSSAEFERCEVLASATAQLQKLLNTSSAPSPHRLEASFTLLRHLRKTSIPICLDVPVKMTETRSLQ